MFHCTIYTFSSRKKYFFYLCEQSQTNADEETNIKRSFVENHVLSIYNNIKQSVFHFTSENIKQYYKAYSIDTYHELISTNYTFKIPKNITIVVLILLSYSELNDRGIRHQNQYYTQVFTGIF